MGKTIPTPEEARAYAEKRRQALQDEQDQELFEQRSQLAGEVQLLLGEVMENEDVDDISRLQAACAALRGDASSVNKADDGLRQELETVKKDRARAQADAEVLKASAEVDEAKLKELEAELHKLRTDKGRLERELEKAKSDKPKPTETDSSVVVKDEKTESDTKTGKIEIESTKPEEGFLARAMKRSRQAWANAQS